MHTETIAIQRLTPETFVTQFRPCREGQAWLRTYFNGSLPGVTRHVLNTTPEQWFAHKDREDGHYGTLRAMVSWFMESYERRWLLNAACPRHNQYLRLPRGCPEEKRVIDAVLFEALQQMDDADWPPVTKGP